MPRRSTTLSNDANLAITREIASKYDNIKKVADKIPEIDTIANADLSQLALDIQSILDFTNITVVTGYPASWNPVTKVLTVEKGSKGDPGLNGAKGDKGNTGDKGEKGDKGISVHHIKGTSTTDPEGDFSSPGRTDTYTLWGDASETINLGSFSITNGAIDEGVFYDGLSAVENSKNASAISENNAVISETNALNSANYSEEWANKPEDVLVSSAAGGDQVDDYSARHWAKKAETFVASYTPSDVLAKIKTVDGIGSGLDADLLDGKEGSYYLPASSYTAADVLAKVKSLDGSGSGLDADLFGGLLPTSYATATQGTKADNALPSSSYTASDVLSKLLTVDGPSSGIDADLLDGRQGSYYLPAASYTASDVFNKVKSLDGSSSGLDADTLDGKQGEDYQLKTDSIDWSRLSNKPGNVDGAVSVVTIDNCGSSGNFLQFSRTGSHVTVGLKTSNCNCNCNCNCGNA